MVYYLFLHFKIEYNMKNIKRVMLNFLFIIILGTSVLNAQTKKYQADVEEKIKLVENGLAGWVKTGFNFNGMTVRKIE